ncbi:V-type ATP synthase subunit E [Ignicoccus islandicus DSM 13165]|uniref:A-type ATP synthase subunit E n=1 Tax=Ignicoccus islandicus DSM 13165 TaxID=940295 RepID=A0A0U3FQT5_9CREN|nr:V-type ATP synthase subunit E [Ignicoccus islandicus]ALU11824.1 V-type ATP synthase subunit E [Ignicoccus islandicus DSM 13165]
MAEKLKFIGSVENVTEKVRADAYSKIDATVDAALKEAKELLSKKLDEVYAPLEVEIEGLLNRASQRLEAEKASLEMELRKRIEELKKQYLNEVIEKAWEVVLKEAREGSERYVKTLERALINMSKEAGDDEVEVYALKKDLETVKRIIEEKGLTNLSVGKSAEEAGLRMSGGVIGKSKKGSIWYNYSLERLFSEVVEELKPKVIEIISEGI